MCEANAYLLKGEREELVMEAVDVIEPRGEELYLKSIFGEQKFLRAKLKTTSLVEHKIILEPV
jgi:predicted RNA-binding protein